MQLLSMRKNEHLPAIETEWKRALPYFQSRGEVIFVNPGLRFWEKHGFVQQSLAHVLVKNGVKVTWLDGAGWRKYHPHYAQSSLLKVEQLFEFPLRRLGVVSRLNHEFIAGKINRLIGKKENPLVWVWGSLREPIAESLKYVDVFSVFDDPRAVSPNGILCEKAKIITCQNPFAQALLSKIHPEKTHLLFPPVDLADSVFKKDAVFSLPEGFPKEVMGYIGSIPYGGFDFVLFENFLQSFPKTGFLLVGPADGQAQRAIEKLKKYPHFHYIPWVKRSEIAAVWKTLDVSLLLYRPAATNDGAFPVKVLEGLHFHVPSVATQVPKTSGLEGYVPRSSFPERLKEMALEQMRASKETLDKTYRHFSYEMHPEIHLSRVATWLR